MSLSHEERGNHDGNGLAPTPPPINISDNHPTVHQKPTQLLDQIKVRLHDCISQLNELPDSLDCTDLQTLLQSGVSKTNELQYLLFDTEFAPIGGSDSRCPNSQNSPASSSSSFSSSPTYTPLQPILDPLSAPGPSLNAPPYAPWTKQQPPPIAIPNDPLELWYEPLNNAIAIWARWVLDHWELAAERGIVKRMNREDRVSAITAASGMLRNSGSWLLGYCTWYSGLLEWELLNLYNEEKEAEEGVAKGAPPMESDGNSRRGSGGYSEHDNGWDSVRRGRWGRYDSEIYGGRIHYRRERGVNHERRQERQYRYQSRRP